MESLYGSWKRAKAPSSSSAAAGNNIPFPRPPQVAHCLVDGCNADLSLCRDYHRRHKVCEMHSKTCRVTIGGRSDQRFCQQCSRFHSLVEFDEGKRSCRKRLDGHNRRRRKPHPNSTGLTTTTLQKAQMLSTNSVNSSCDIMLYNNSSNNPHQIHPTQNALSECSSAHNNSSNNTVFTETISNRLNNQVVDCDRALSLLSSAYYQQVVRVQTTPEHLFPQSMQYNSTTGLLGHDEYDDLYKYIHHQENKAADSHPSTLHFPEMVRRHDHHEGSSTSEGGSRQTHTFMWE